MKKGSRKLIVALVALTMSFILALAGILEGPQWVPTVGFVVGLFSASNLGEYFSGS